MLLKNAIKTLCLIAVYSHCLGAVSLDIFSNLSPLDYLSEIQHLRRILGKPSEKLIENDLFNFIRAAVLKYDSEGDLRKTLLQLSNYSLFYNQLDAATREKTFRVLPLNTIKQNFVSSFIPYIFDMEQQAYQSASARIKEQTKYEPYQLFDLLDTLVAKGAPALGSTQRLDHNQIERMRIILYLRSLVQNRETLTLLKMIIESLENFATWHTQEVIMASQRLMSQEAIRQEQKRAFQSLQQSAENLRKHLLLQNDQKTKELIQELLKAYSKTLQNKATEKIIDGL